MHTPKDRTSSPASNVFSPAFLATLRERDETITASEAELAGPWKREAIRDRKGAVAVLRDWESLEGGDEPAGTFWHEETAQLFAAILPAVEREPLFHLGEESGPDGFPVLAVYGEQGAQVAGWLPRYEPSWIEALHFAEALARSPRALAEILEAAGPGVIEQVGRILASRLL
ncbi:MAG TPA: hypothetical protein VOA87_10195 [Thermoanaerobaculia bacterium]|nr:hypothetical protein [Thermoanaerobaculia bacterium]